MKTTTYKITKALLLVAFTFTAVTATAADNDREKSAERAAARGGAAVGAAVGASAGPAGAVAGGAAGAAIATAAEEVYQKNREAIQKPEKELKRAVEKARNVLRKLKL